MVTPRSRYPRKRNQEKHSGCAAKASRACAASPSATCSVTSWWKRRSISPRGRRNCCTNWSKSTSTTEAATIRAPRAGWTKCANSSSRRQGVILNDRKGPRRGPFRFRLLARSDWRCRASRPQPRGTDFHHVAQCRQGTAKRFPGLGLVRFLPRPQARRRRHLRPLAVGLIAGHLQKQWLIALHPHPEWIRIRLHIGSRRQAVEPLDRYRKEGGLRAVAPEESGNADQIAVTIEQATTGGALAECCGDLDDAAVAIRVKRGHAAGRNVAACAATESDRHDFIADFKSICCGGLRARCGQRSGMQNAQVCDRIAGSAL